MEKYELTVVYPGSITAANLKVAQEGLEKIIKVLGGKVEKCEKWGEKELSYKINNNASGMFIHYQLELAKDAVKDLTEKLRIEEAVIRNLLVKTD